MTVIWAGDSASVTTRLLPDHHHRRRHSPGEWLESIGLFWSHRPEKREKTVDPSTALHCSQTHNSTFGISSLDESTELEEI